MYIRRPSGAVDAVMSGRGLAWAIAARQDEGVPDPGWYPDPLGSSQLRLWSGTAWTQNLKDRSDPAAAGAKEPTSGSAPPVFPDVLVAAGALATLVGVRLPWVRVGSAPLAFSRYGTNIDGVRIVGLTTAVIGLLIVAFSRPLAPRRFLWCAIAALGAVVALIALLDLWAVHIGAIRITRIATRVRATAEPGIYVTIAAGLTVFVGGTARMAAQSRRFTATGGPARSRSSSPGPSTTDGSSLDGSTRGTPAEDPHAGR